MASVAVNATRDEPAPAAGPLSLQCMEIWGGNQITDAALSVPGLDVWIAATPHGGSEAGGDIHYLSMCGSGRISRFVLADVAGHGADVSTLSTALRKLMRKHINTLDQTRFARALNTEFGALHTGGRFATAVLSTYFAPTSDLIVVNAGHPRPVWRQAATGRWRMLDPEQLDESDIRLPRETTRYGFHPVSNLPLGVIEPTAYEQFAVRLAPGDLVLLYTDSLIESRPAGGPQLGEKGLLDMVRSLPGSHPKTFVADLAEALTRYRGGFPAEDDQTMLLLHVNGRQPPPMTLRQTVRSLAKMVGLMKV